jgi:hypothetical protein
VPAVFASPALFRLSASWKNDEFEGARNRGYDGEGEGGYVTKGVEDMVLKSHRTRLVSVFIFPTEELAYIQ